MVKSAIVLLQIVFAATAVLSQNFENENGFIHIGTFQWVSGAQARSAPPVLNEYDYYMSTNPAAWASVAQDCKNALGGTQLAIETPEEWAFLKEILEPYGATSYWTGGMYDSSSSVWRWTSNNAPFTTFATSPWAVGYPKTPSAVTRVLIFYGSRYDASWGTAANTQSNRYICEVLR